MRVLILDDDNFRHKIFKQRLAEYDVRHAHTYHEFRIALDRGSPWDLVYLDHDLGEMEYGDTYIDGWGNEREYNGYHAAMLICELPDERLPRSVIVQSVNSAGSRSIMLALQKRGVPVDWQPFGMDPEDYQEGGVMWNDMQFEGKKE